MKNRLFTPVAVVSDTEAEVHVLDVITDSPYWGSNPKALSEQLAAAKGKNLTVKIHSPGGSVRAGAAMYAALKEHDGKKTALIMGSCMSMATIVAAACDYVKMSAAATFMIHDPANYGAGGNITQIETQLQALYSIRDAMCAVYMQRTGLSEEKIKEMMKAETYMNAAEALKLGFIDEIVHPPKAKEMAEFVALCRPETTSFAPEPTLLTPTVTPQTQTNKMKFAFLLTMLGLSAEATEAQAETALNAYIQAENKKAATKAQAELVAQFAAANPNALKPEAKEFFDIVLAADPIKALKMLQPAAAETGEVKTQQILNTPVNPFLIETPNATAGKTTVAAGDRAKWTYDDWRKNDMDGLKALHKSEPEAFKKLYDDQFKK